MSRIASALIASLCLIACSGVETIPDDTAAFVATGYSSYAWRSEPLEPTGLSKSRLYAADPAIRSAVDKRLAELGYREVAKENAEFLVDYVAAAGFNQGEMARGGTNITPLPTGMINRQINQAEMDNAYALSGVREMGNVALVFLDGRNQDLLWKVTVSMVVENTNEVDVDGLRRAMRHGLETLPSAPD
jgi:hypothetical protein